METKSISVRLPLDLWKEFKKYCVENEKSMQEVLENMVIEIVEGENESV